MSTSPKEKYKIGQRYFMPRYGIVRISGVETEKISGMEIEMFRLTFDSPNDIFSGQANINKIKKVPVIKADKNFFDFPTKKQLVKIVALATSESQATSGRWKNIQTRFEDALKSGDLTLIAHVFRKTKEGMDGVEAPYSKRILYDEALRTLCAVYAEVHQINYAEGLNIFVAPKVEPVTEAPAEPPVSVSQSTPTMPQPREARTSIKADLGPKWDMPIVSALRVSSIFSQKTRDLIIEKLPCKSLSELFNLTQGDWPKQAPATSGISTEDARIIQYDTQELVKHLTRNVA